MNSLVGAERHGYVRNLPNSMDSMSFTGQRYDSRKSRAIPKKRYFHIDMKADDAYQTFPFLQPKGLTAIINGLALKCKIS